MFDYYDTEELNDDKAEELSQRLRQYPEIFAAVEFVLDKLDGHEQRVKEAEARLHAANRQLGELERLRAQVSTLTETCNTLVSRLP